MAVAEGQFVQQGDLLAVLDDGVQRLRAEMGKANADSLLTVELAGVEMKQSAAELERIGLLSGGDNASIKELQDAKAKAETARLKYATAKLKHEQAIREYEFQSLLLERLYIRAPFAGYVTETFKETGETVVEAGEIIRLVELNPLDVTVDCPVALAPYVKAGDRVVVVPVEPHWQPRAGEVIFASRVVDPASQTFKVRLLVDNEDDGWISGLKVLVDFSCRTTGTE